MNKIILFLPIFLLPWIGCIKPQIVIKHIPQKGERIRIAVLPFKDAPGAPGSGEIAAESMTTHLLRVNSYEIIERSALEQILKEQKLGVTGAIDLETAAQLGKILGADALVIGAITEYQKRKNMVLPPAKATVTARMVRTQTGVLDWTATCTAGWHPLKWILFMPPPGMFLGPTFIMSSPTVEDRIQKASRKIAEQIVIKIQGKTSK